MKKLKVDSRLHLPGAYELARRGTKRNSPIMWKDSGKLGVVKKVPGGTIDPGKVVSGLARAAQNSGAQIIENAEAVSIDFEEPLKIHIRIKSRKGIQQKTISAGKILVATNAGSLELARLQKIADPMLTFAIATEPLTIAQRKALGLNSRRPFYTIDFPYLWGRLMENNGAIFGAGIVGIEGAGNSRVDKQIQVAIARVRASAASSARLKSRTSNANPLAAVNIHKKGPAGDRLASLEHRIRNLHRTLKSVRITHRWGGPILLTEKMRPIFRHHPSSKNILILAGFNGHGVALSVYLGHWAAQSLLDQRPLPNW